jgi:hypothetical protein
MKLLDDSKLLKSHTGNATDAESVGDSMTIRGEHVKDRNKYNEGIQTILPQPESKNSRFSDVEELNSLQYSRKQEKKRRKKHKKKKKGKSTADGSEGSKATEGDEHRSYQWAEETFETLGISTAYQAQTNGHCWSGTHEPGKRCHEDEELEHDYGEDDGFCEVVNRRKPKKGKHRHNQYLRGVDTDI